MATETSIFLQNILKSVPYAYLSHNQSLSDSGFSKRTVDTQQATFDPNDS